MSSLHIFVFLLLFGKIKGGKIEASEKKSCHAGYERFEASCYKVIVPTNNPMTFSQANATCAADGAQLASVHSEAENRFLSGMVKRLSGSEKYFYWLGLNTPKGTAWEANKFKWTDGTPVDFGNPIKTGQNHYPWSLHNPTISKPDMPNPENCVQLMGFTEIDWMEFGKWNDVPCDAALVLGVRKSGAICKMGECPSGWTLFKGNCYQALTNSGGKTWAEADTQCNSLGGKIASLHSDAEWQFVKKIIEEKVAKNGGNKHSSRNFFWSGLRLKWDGKNLKEASWSDGTPVDYLNPKTTGAVTKPFELDNYTPPEECVLFGYRAKTNALTNDLYLLDINCGLKSADWTPYGVVCKRPQ